MMKPEELQAAYSKIFNNLHDLGFADIVKLRNLLDYEIKARIEESDTND